MQVPGQRLLTSGEVVQHLFTQIGDRQLAVDGRYLLVHSPTPLSHLVAPHLQKTAAHAPLILPGQSLG